LFLARHNTQRNIATGASAFAPLWCDAHIMHAGLGATGTALQGQVTLAMLGTSLGITTNGTSTTPPTAIVAGGALDDPMSQTLWRAQTVDNMPLAMGASMNVPVPGVCGNVQIKPSGGCNYYSSPPAYVKVVSHSSARLSHPSPTSYQDLGFLGLGRVTCELTGEIQDATADDDLIIQVVGTHLTANGLDTLVLARYRGSCLAGKYKSISASAHLDFGCGELRDAVGSRAIDGVLVGYHLEYRSSRGGGALSVSDLSVRIDFPDIDTSDACPYAIAHVSKSDQPCSIHIDWFISALMDNRHTWTKFTLNDYMPPHDQVTAQMGLLESGLQMVQVGHAHSPTPLGGALSFKKLWRKFLRPVVKGGLNVATKAIPAFVDPVLGPVAGDMLQRAAQSGVNMIPGPSSSRAERGFEAAFR